jgi:hypothetical protein
MTIDRSVVPGERFAESAAMSAARAPTASVGAESPPPELATAAMRLQIMSTEHWSLLASRQLSWNESFTRGGMFLSTLSFSAVSLALVAQATGFGEAFRLFALVVLPVVLFLGIGTMLRLDNAGHHDVQCIIGMNRIRAGYLELAPDLDRYFVMGTTDDRRGIELTMANMPTRSASSAFLAAIPFQIAVLNSVLVGVIAALAAVQLGSSMNASIVVGAAGFACAIVMFIWYERRTLSVLIGDYQPRFPGPDGG